MYKASVITVSDKTFTGEREDTSGEYITNYLKEKDFEIVSYGIIPETDEIIRRNLIKCCDVYKVDLLIAIGITRETFGRIFEDKVLGLNEVIKDIDMKILNKETSIGVRCETLLVNITNYKENYESDFDGIVNFLKEEIVRISLERRVFKRASDY
ncbi:molybdopterin-binding protein [Clostridium sp. LP20]|uniref:molybdopterin-binding protein n=1 Tax=Clostridium sp. LP20 TaxID=3418665 RepID=UPI003EE61045